MKYLITLAVSLVLGLSAQSQEVSFIGFSFAYYGGKVNTGIDDYGDPKYRALHYNGPESNKRGRIILDKDNKHLTIKWNDGTDWPVTITKVRQEGSSMYYTGKYDNRLNKECELVVTYHGKDFGFSTSLYSTRVIDENYDIDTWKNIYRLGSMGKCLLSNGNALIASYNEEERIKQEEWEAGADEREKERKIKEAKKEEKRKATELAKLEYEKKEEKEDDERYFKRIEESNEKYNVAQSAYYKDSIPLTEVAYKLMNPLFDNPPYNRVIFYFRIKVGRTGVVKFVDPLNDPYREGYKGASLIYEKIGSEYFRATFKPAKNSKGKKTESWYLLKVVFEKKKSRWES